MWYQFILENIHFILNIFVAGIFFSAFWLYFDALKGKGGKDTLKILGYLLLALSFAAHSIMMESSFVQSTLFPQDILSVVFLSLRILGLLFILIGVFADPLQPRPTEKISLGGFLFAPIIEVAKIFPPILAGLIGLTYLRRATIGLEAHIKKPAISFFLFAFSELVGLYSLFSGTTNPQLFKIVAPFGPFWIAEHILLLVSVIFMAIWVFSYLLKRFETQTFIFISSSIMIVFLITTTVFSAFLLVNVRNEALTELSGSVKVLNHLLSSKKEELASNAELVASDARIIESVTQNGKGIRELVSAYLLNKKDSNLILLDINGKVIARGEDADKIGDSMSDDPLVKKALAGESSSSVFVKEGVVAPEVYVRSSYPVKSGGEIIGVVVAGEILDNTFLDGIKSSTGLDAVIYGGNKISAASILLSDGSGRPLGVTEKSTVINDTVLKQGNDYRGNVKIGGVGYLSAISPLKDVDNVTQGMMSASRTETSVFNLAVKSIELTYLIAAAMIILSIIPSYFVSKQINRQLE
jgi:hypothetical protein